MDNRIYVIVESLSEIEWDIARQSGIQQSTIELTRKSLDLSMMILKWAAQDNPTIPIEKILLQGSAAEIRAYLKDNREDW